MNVTGGIVKKGRSSCRRKSLSRQHIGTRLVTAANCLLDPLLQLLPMRQEFRGNEYFTNVSIRVDCRRWDLLTADELKFCIQMCSSPASFTDWTLLCCWGTPRDLVGLARFNFRLDEGKEPVLELLDVQLLPEVRGKGLGRFLVESLVLLAEKTRMSKTLARTPRSNVAGLAFYRALNFVQPDEAEQEKENALLSEWLLMQRPTTSP